MIRRPTPPYSPASNRIPTAQRVLSEGQLGGLWALDKEHLLSKIEAGHTVYVIRDVNQHARQAVGSYVRSHHNSVTANTAGVLEMRMVFHLLEGSFEARALGILTKENDSETVGSWTAFPMSDSTDTLAIILNPPSVNDPKNCE